MHGGRIRDGRSGGRSAAPDAAALMTLEFSHNSIGGAGAAALAEAVKFGASLTTLHLAGNGIENAGAAALAEAVKVRGTLTALHLDGNNIGGAARAAVAVVLSRNNALAAGAPATREAAALAYLLLHAATRGAPPPNVVVCALAALRPRPAA